MVSLGCSCLFTLPITCPHFRERLFQDCLKKSPSAEYAASYGEGLRAALLDGRSFHPRGYDAAHGEEAGTCLSMFRRSQ